MKLIDLMMLLILFDILIYNLESFREDEVTKRNVNKSFVFPKPLSLALVL